MGGKEKCGLLAKAFSARCIHPPLQFVHYVLDFTIYDIEVSERPPVQRAAVQEAHGSIEDAGVQKPSAKGHRDTEPVQPPVRSVASTRCQPFAVVEEFLQLNGNLVVAEFGKITAQI